MNYAGVWRGADYSVGFERSLWSPPVFGPGFWSDRFLADRAENPRAPEPEGARAALVRDIRAADFDWLLRGL